MENKLRILAVDDSAVNLAAIEQQLKSKYDVVAVNSGVRALRFLETEKPDLILLDIQMSMIDGIETLRELRMMENGVSVPVIMLTSKKDKKSVLESTKLGIYDYVLKPFDAQDLHDRIERALKKAGFFPMDDSELYMNIKEIKKQIVTGHVEQAIEKIDKILTLKIDEEISGRMQSVQAKLGEGDEETAHRMIDRILRILERNVDSEVLMRQTLSVEDMKGYIKNILEALEHFKVHEATKRLEELLCFDLPPDMDSICHAAQKCLEEFDDGAAEELIRKAMDELTDKEGG